MQSEHTSSVTDRVDRLRAGFLTGETLSIGLRLRQLRTLYDSIRANESALLKALHQDLGKPEMEAYLAEIAYVQSEISHALRHLAKWCRPQRRKSPWLAWPSRSFLSPEPYGVVLIIAPWNYPFGLLVSPLVGAIAAGNCVCLKPSEYAPATSSVVAQMLRSIFAEDHVSTMEGDQSVAESLLSERFDYIFFTGSSRVGRRVLEKAAQHLTPVTLELGGKCPCIVCKDAYLETAARRILWGKCMNAGQTCVAPDYVLVDRAIKLPFLSALKETLTRFYGADPMQSKDYGRIVNRKHFQRLFGYLNQGRIVIGGAHDEESLFLEPTVLVDVNPDAPVMQDEIFGPILPVVEFTSLDDTLDALRRAPKPLALYLFTNDRANRQKVLSRTSSGSVCVNDTIVQILGKDLPFGGVGESGMGNYHGKASFDCFTHYKSVMAKPSGLDFSFRYPPTSPSWERLKRIYEFLMRR